MNDQYDTGEVSLWRGRDLSAPGRPEKLSKQELAHWRKTLTTAIQRHEYLASPSGRTMIELSHQQSIARMTASLLDFRDWLDSGDQARSLAKLKKQMTALEAAEQSRIAKAESKTAHKKSSDSKLTKALLIIGDDPDIRSAIVAKHGSVEKFAKPFEVYRKDTQMKVVINVEHGGFGLSHEAVMKFAELEGFRLRFEDVHGLRHYYKSDTNAYFSERDIPRDNASLIRIVEEAGDAADGQYAKLKIVEIPDDIEWCIEEYDGSEWVAEMHRTWR